MEIRYVITEADYNSSVSAPIIPTTQLSSEEIQYLTTFFKD